MFNRIQNYYYIEQKKSPCMEIFRGIGLKKRIEIMVLGPIFKVQFTSSIVNVNPHLKRLYNHRH